MRVALLTDASVFAGTERHMLDLARGLQNAGATVRIGCPVPSALQEKAPLQGVEIVPIQKGGLIDQAAIRKLCELLKAGEIDVIHSHNGRMALSAAVAVRLAGRGACVATQHFLKPNRLSRHGVTAVLSRLAHRWVSGQTAHCIAISEAARADMLARKDAPARKITVIPNGIFDPRETSLAAPDAVRRKLGIDPDAPLIVCAARLEPEKDVSSLIAAMGKVRVAHPAVRCVVAGEGSREESLREQIRATGLKETVELLGFRTDALALIAAGDVFVLPSLAEPFGLVILEAMALGRPVVATRAGGPREIVIDGRTGLLTPPQDPEALAGAICGLLAQPDYRQELALAGRQRFLEQFTAQRMAAQTLEVYRLALSRVRHGESRGHRRFVGAIGES